MKNNFSRAFSLPTKKRGLRSKCTLGSMQMMVSAGVQYEA